MNDDITVAFIGLAGTIVSIILTARLNGTVRRVRDQVENEHPGNPTKTSNLRDDLDTKHAELRHDIGGIRAEIRQLRTDLSLIGGRVHELETTHERNKR